MDMTSELFGSYEDLYQAAFGTLSNDTVMSNVYAGLAIAAYERTLLATKAPFQKWLNGDVTALSAKQKEGAILFFGKAECYTCHNGPALSSMDFYALGMKDLDGPGVYLVNDPTIKLGRGGFTGNSADDYKFKVPQLYNLINSRFYGHGASFHSVEEVIRYKNNATSENLAVPAGQLAAGFHPLHLSSEEIEAITDFIEHGLYDADLKRYVPANIPSGNCFPNNDYRSAHDRGCN
jgi:cytochrome c peroxidase